MRVFSFELGKQYKFMLSNVKDITGQRSRGVESATENCNCIFTASEGGNENRETLTSQSHDRKGISRKRGDLLEGFFRERRSEWDRRH